VGQYYVIANLDKNEFIDPYAFGNGVKLMEFAMDSSSTMTALAILLASSNGQGGGDLHLPHDSSFAGLPGRWAGDRIVVAGDYDEREGSPGCGVYGRCNEVSPVEEIANVGEATGAFTDISYEVLGCLLEDDGFRSDYLNVTSGNATWMEWLKKKRREAWLKARPNDEMPEVLV
jgi:hypothetical protein